MTVLGAFEVAENGDLAGVSREELQARSGAPLRFAADCGVLAAPDIVDAG